jgi:sensor c-di-GMP phosphodiesterase-like protein
MAIRLSDTSEATSGDTLAALAQVIRVLAPEVCSVSFHDFAADTLWLSEDFLLPEDHQQLVEDTLSGYGEAGSEMTFGGHDGARYTVAIPVRDTHGEVNGAVRLSIDSQVAGTRATKPLDTRLAAVLECLAVEFERRGVLPPLSPKDEAQLAQFESALNAEHFELYLQPISALQEEEGPAHYEILLRLRTADGELLEHEAFLDTAAHRHLMPAVDRWMVRSLLVWLVNNRKLWEQVPAVFSINLAAQSLTDADFLSYVESCVVKSGVPPQALCFELAELSTSGNISVAESMKRLEALGCEVALDWRADFAVGV